MDAHWRLSMCHAYCVGAITCTLNLYPESTPSGNLSVPAPDSKADILKDSMFVIRGRWLAIIAKRLALPIN
jgi:hypothetical protein